MGHPGFPGLHRQDRDNAAATPEVRSCVSWGRSRSVELAAHHAPRRLFGDGSGVRNAAHRASPNRRRLCITSGVVRIAAIALVFLATATPPPARAQVDTTPEPDVGVSVLPLILAVDEGQTSLISVALKSRPTAPVVVRLWRDTTDHISINRFRLRFTPRNWDRSRTVRLRGLQDADAVDDVTTFTITATGGNYDAIENFIRQVRTIDDEEVAEATVLATW